MPSALAMAVACRELTTTRAFEPFVDYSPLPIGVEAVRFCPPDNLARKPQHLENI